MGLKVHINSKTTRWFPKYRQVLWTPASHDSLVLWKPGRFLPLANVQLPGTLETGESWLPGFQSTWESLYCLCEKIVLISNCVLSIWNFYRLLVTLHVCDLHSVEIDRKLTNWDQHVFFILQKMCWSQFVSHLPEIVQFVYHKVVYNLWKFQIDSSQIDQHKFFIPQKSRPPFSKCGRIVDN